MGGRGEGGGMVKKEKWVRGERRWMVWEVREESGVTDPVGMRHKPGLIRFQDVWKRCTP